MGAAPGKVRHTQKPGGGGGLTESRRALRTAQRRACTPTDPGEVPRSSMPKRNLEGEFGPKEDF